MEAQKSSFFRRFFISLFILMLCGIGYISFEAWNFLSIPANKEAKSFPVEIAENSTLRTICTQLQEKGIISDKLKFELFTRLKKQENKIQAGTFLLSPAWTPDKILHELTTGSALLYKITIREGLPWWEVAKLLEEQGFCYAKDFKQVIYDKNFLHKKNIPFANAEGYLYPDTYLLPKPKQITEQDAYKIASRLIDTFYLKTASLKNNTTYQKILNSHKNLISY